MTMFKMAYPRLPLVLMIFFGIVLYCSCVVFIAEMTKETAVKSSNAICEVKLKSTFDAWKEAEAKLAELENKPAPICLTPIPDPHKTVHHKTHHPSCPTARGHLPTKAVPREQH